MTSLDMDGPFKLDTPTVRQTVRGGLPGNFAIGHLDGDKRFAVQYVGRHDLDVLDGLMTTMRAGVGKPGLTARLFGSQRQANAFKFSYAADQRAAFEKQCRNYHDFNGSGKLENAAHPVPPSGSGLTCPSCAG
ncbi:MAG: hypothetical protein WD341_07675 [Tistlia sp.]|uniref:hypothetical protein n=1 Tax=Tistlia sp. TaxID=3057121 RepID=UPI0034A17D93